MDVPKIILLTFVTYALCDEALVEPCGYRDIECLSKGTEKFLDKTSAGIPQYNIKAIDPLTIAHVEYADPGSDIVMHFHNSTINGLKDQKISDFSMDISTKSVVLQTKIKANIVSNLLVELKGPSKFLSGTYNAKATVLGTAKYNYDLKVNDKGMEYFDVGPETITCEAVGVPEVTLDSEFAKTLSNDPDAVARKADYEKRAAEIRQKAACKILAQAYAVVIENLRTTAKLLPKTSFFSDI